MYVGIMSNTMHLMNSLWLARSAALRRSKSSRAESLEGFVQLDIGRVIVPHVVVTPRAFLDALRSRT